MDNLPGSKFEPGSTALKYTTKAAKGPAGSRRVRERFLKMPGSRRTAVPSGLGHSRGCKGFGKQRVTENGLEGFRPVGNVGRWNKCDGDVFAFTGCSRG